ncbi:hypothetical protein PKB_1285 [Pseudomonas knackmussii B13]|uniref:Uncharacterized protein n=1 Tax=Pseudomonas knackmussii (strain DSM 6978 / CCUG 54928 / LMG 23759 / B13) TaxID=1301098 RepID=A0A024HC68_PSEKB|nr:hypothetical protein [Pseudomonas knackmussii]CDF82650.1 hypothetical protein PKB_1285 [Pseudomonas knackmussii B13]
MSDLSILFPKAEEVLLGRRRVEIRPVAFEHFAEFGAAAKGLIELVGAGSTLEIATYAEQHAAELGKVVVHCTNLSRWRVRRLPASVIVQLVAHVVRANADFFGQAQVATAKALRGPLSPSG